ncbi:hypothetical protein [Geomicrobium sp. JCM 19039]|uniref:hypothetical protein n=1 Tax=Geomicrobium sp. JCM 19039 TaxID=1460636 RepID=UPI00045F3BE9|nr:hypothetical protein [Geomicrobium sp. JCM 19039]GAK12814.1 hypothetical protein JCM19039_2615 [Geomicrobium sp. JCM 19039]
MLVGMIEDVVCRLLTTNREEIPYQRIVVIEEEDITELRALDFIEKRTVAVINARASLTGRKWHQGVKKLIANHIPVFDLVHRGDVKQIQQNRKVRVKNGSLHIRRSGKWDMLGHIKYYDPERVERLIESAKQREVWEKQRTVEQKLVHMGEALRSMKLANELWLIGPFSSLSDMRTFYVILQSSKSTFGNLRPSS